MFRDLLLARKVQPIPVSLRTLAGADLIQTELVELVRAAVVGALEHYRSISSGQRLAPTNGVPPMVGFAGMLTDEEAAAVISYVRQSFGNNLPMIQPAQVARVRGQTRDRADFYMVEEIMKEHPIPGWEQWGRMARPKDNPFE